MLIHNISRILLKISKTGSKEREELIEIECEVVLFNFTANLKSTFVTVILNSERISY